jgi:hypothetical protein
MTTRWRRWGRSAPPTRPRWQRRAVPLLLLLPGPRSPPPPFCTLRSTGSAPALLGRYAWLAAPAFRGDLRLSPGKRSEVADALGSAASVRLTCVLLVVSFFFLYFTFLLFFSVPFQRESGEQLRRKKGIDSSDLIFFAFAF